jgi:uncharacterized protein YoxC
VKTKVALVIINLVLVWCLVIQSSIASRSMRSVRDCTVTLQHDHDVMTRQNALLEKQNRMINEMQALLKTNSSPAGKTSASRGD